MEGTLTIESAARLIEFASAAEQSFAANLSDDDRVEAGTPERWGATAALAHLADWKAIQVERMRAELEGRPAPVCDGLPFPHRDAEAYAPFAALAWDGIPEWLATVGADLAAVTRRFADGDIERRFEWTLGKPLAQQLMGRGVWHTMTHLTEHHRQRGRDAAATRLSTQLAGLIAELRAWPLAGDAASHYNVACLCALGGRLDDARVLLDEAIALDPSFAEHARTDSDLAAVA